MSGTRKIRENRRENRLAENLFEYTDEVRSALESGEPVVALESTIISHGMPYPTNVEVAMEGMAIIRSLGVVPAPIVIKNRRIRIGLDPKEIEHFGTAENIVKVSRRDIAATLQSGADGATTVAATMYASFMAGIDVFATGGIGGVHRGAGESFDVSADLRELGRTPLIVVSAGAKAILDLPATLEVLETEGVPVVGFLTDEFPAFYSGSSGLPVPIRADSAAEIVGIYKRQIALGLSQALLVVNPIPIECEIPLAQLNDYVDRAISELDELRITGKAVTPFLLSRITELSGGASLEANIELFKSNVRLASQIAAECDL